jgi:hypothetical protein
MKAALSFVAVALILSALILLGCVPGLQTVKPTPEGSVAPPTGQAEGAKAPEPSGQAADKSTSPPAPTYAPPPPPDKEKVSEAAVDLRMKDEVNEAAVKFAKEIPNVKYMRTCYSKWFGGWYLILYRQQKKNFLLQQFQWNDRSKEWEPSYNKKLTTKEAEAQLKVEVAGEKCFRLK